MIPSDIIKCPRCLCEKCASYKKKTSIWYYCFNCAHSGTKGWMFDNNRRGMKTQLSVRSYLHECRRNIVENGIPHSIRMPYGIPSAAYDPFYYPIYHDFLFLGKMSEFRKSCRTFGEKLSSPRGEIKWSNEYVFSIIQDRVGKVCGLLVLLKSKVVPIFMHYASKNADPKVIFNLSETENVVEVDSFLEGMDLFKLYSSLNIHSSILFRVLRQAK